MSGKRSKKGNNGNSNNSKGFADTVKRVESALLEVKKLGTRGRHLAVQLKEDKSNYRIWWAATIGLMGLAQSSKLRVDLKDVLQNNMKGDAYVDYHDEDEDGYTYEVQQTQDTIRDLLYSTIDPELLPSFVKCDLYEWLDEIRPAKDTFLGHLLCEEMQNRKCGIDTIDAYLA